MFTTDIFAERVKTVQTSGIRRMMALAQQIRDVVSLTAGDPDFRTPKHINEAAIEAIKKEYGLT